MYVYDGDFSSPAELKNQSRSDKYSQREYFLIRDDTTGLYLIGRKKLGAPVPTCVWGDRRADAIAYDNAMEARRIAAEIGENTTSVYRMKSAGGDFQVLRN